MQEGYSLEKVVNYKFPRYDELPCVSLYKEQVIEYIEGIFNVFTFFTGEKVLTPTMLNNYVKQQIVSHPKDKKYNREHVAYLITVCVLKQVFTLQETCKMIRVQIEKYPLDKAYDYFCTELEIAIKSVFETRDFSAENSATKVTNETELLRSVVLSVAHRFFAQVYLLEKGYHK